MAADNDDEFPDAEIVVPTEQLRAQAKKLARVAAKQCGIDRSKIIPCPCGCEKLVTVGDQLAAMIYHGIKDAFIEGVELALEVDVEAVEALSQEEAALEQKAKFVSNGGRLQ